MKVPNLALCLFAISGPNITRRVWVWSVGLFFPIRPIPHPLFCIFFWGQTYFFIRRFYNENGLRLVDCVLLYIHIYIYIYAFDVRESSPAPTSGVVNDLIIADAAA